jgi:hypothetical protein
VALLNQACLHALRQRRTKQNPAADVLLPEARPPKTRKSFTIEQLDRLLVDAIPQGRPSDDVAQGPDVRATAGGAGRVTVAVRRH